MCICLTLAMNSKAEDQLPPHALLESGNKLLKECRSDLETVNKQLKVGVVSINLANLANDNVVNCLNLTI